MWKAAQRLCRAQNNGTERRGCCFVSRGRACDALAQGWGIGLIEIVCQRGPDLNLMQWRRLVFAIESSSGTKHDFSLLVDERAGWMGGWTGERAHAWAAQDGSIISSSLWIIWAACERARIYWSPACFLGQTQQKKLALFHVSHFAFRTVCCSGL